MALDPNMAFDPDSAMQVLADNGMAPASPTNTGTPASFAQTYGFPMMMLSGAIAGVGDLLNGQNQAAALKTQANYQTWAAGQDLNRAKLQTTQVQQETQARLMAAGTVANRTIGAQRTGYASQGVNVASGTPLAEQVQTGQMSAIDSLTIRNNASLKAWGINTGAEQESTQATFAALGERAQASQSLALGGAKAANDILSQEDQYLSSRQRGVM